jgi:hypothetical protein
LKTKIDSIQNYDLVFVGFPTWGQYFVIKDEKAKEAEHKVKEWLQKIKVILKAH